VVAALWASILLVLCGAVVAGLSVLAVTTVGWLLWGWWSSLREDRPAPAPPGS
jgi:hypothetical protein